MGVCMCNLLGVGWGSDEGGAWMYGVESTMLMMDGVFNTVAPSPSLQSCVLCEV